MADGDACSHMYRCTQQQRLHGVGKAFLNCLTEESACNAQAENVQRKAVGQKRKATAGAEGAAGAAKQPRQWWEEEQEHAHDDDDDVAYYRQEARMQYSFVGVQRVEDGAVVGGARIVEGMGCGGRRQGPQTTAVMPLAAPSFSAGMWDNGVWKHACDVRRSRSTKTTITTTCPTVATRRTQLHQKGLWGTWGFGSISCVARRSRSLQMTTTVWWPIGARRRLSSLLQLGFLLSCAHTCKALTLVLL